MIEKKILDKYNNIQLLERYKLLSENYCTNNGYKQKNDFSELNKFISTLNNKFKYNTKESFFGLTEKVENFKFKLTLSLKHGLVETVIWCENICTGNQYGAPISRLVKQIQLSNKIDKIVKIQYPRFSSNEDAKEIIQEVYNIYEDLKKEFLKDEGYS